MLRDLEDRPSGVDRVYERARNSGSSPVIARGSQVGGQAAQLGQQQFGHARVAAAPAAGERLGPAGGLANGGLPGGCVEVVEDPPVLGADLVVVDGGHLRE
jgi:hypothetical protein